MVEIIYNICFLPKFLLAVFTSSLQWRLEMKTAMSQLLYRGWVNRHQVRVWVKVWGGEMKTATSQWCKIIYNICFLPKILLAVFTSSLQWRLEMKTAMSQLLYRGWVTRHQVRVWVKVWGGEMKTATSQWWNFFLYLFVSFQSFC
jgi:glycopeptide antibiotics resistance protein